MQLIAKTKHNNLMKLYILLELTNFIAEGGEEFDLRKENLA